MNTMTYVTNENSNPVPTIKNGLGQHLQFLQCFGLFLAKGKAGSYLRLKTNLSLCVFLRCAHLDSAQ